MQPLLWAYSIPCAISPDVKLPAFCLALNNSPLTLLIYWGGLSGADATHLCSFDMSLIGNIPNITLKGFVAGKALTDLMANAKLLIAPSVCYENNPLSILEAHSMGVPVVTMNYGGMAELVEDGKTGVLASSKAPESMAEAVKKCLDNTEYYKTLKTNCETESKNIMGVAEYCDILIHQYINLMDKR